MSLKGFIKGVLTLLFGRDICQLTDKRLEGVELVTFDVFDTLVLRSCGEPAGVFDLMERRWNEMHSDGPIYGFRAKRMEAEEIARSAAGSSVEITLEDIYSRVDFVSADSRKMLMELEKACELEVCQPNPVLVAFFNKVLESKRVAIISDMYLPAYVIEGILKKCAVKGYERLFVSSESGAMKRNGRLFEVALSELSAEPGNVLHVGDHALADYLAPKKMGLRAFLYKA